jgi:hypothetical protein
VQVAELAIKEKQSHLSYLEALLGAEVEEREPNTVARRVRDAHFPRRWKNSLCSDTPHIPVAQIRNLAEGGYLQRSEPVFFLEKPGRARPRISPSRSGTRCSRTRGHAR